MSEAHAIVLWCEAVRALYNLARSERRAELEGRRSRLLDSRGLHPLSLEVGRVLALQDIYPLLEELEFWHLDIRKAAQNDAEEQYKMETAVEIGQRNGWITSSLAECIRHSNGP